MDSGDLRVFEAVARLGSMSQAASELNTVQSNVTARIKLMEDRLGMRLFERHNRGVTLTSAGKRLMPFAVRVGRLIDEADRSARDDGTPKGPLIIGSLETTAALALAPVLASYATAFPDVDLALRTGTSTELVEQVLLREIEGAFVCGPVDHPELDVRRIFREELVIMTAPSVSDFESWAKQGNFRIVVLRAGCSYRLRLEAMLARRGIVDVRMLEFGTLDAIVGCVAAGIGITLMPRSLIGKVYAKDRVAIHRLADEDTIVETVFIRHKEAFVSSAMTAFLDMVRPIRSAPQAAE